MVATMDLDRLQVHRKWEMSDFNMPWRFYGPVISGTG